MIGSSIVHLLPETGIDWLGRSSRAGLQRSRRSRGVRRRTRCSP